MFDLLYTQQLIARPPSILKDVKCTLETRSESSSGRICAETWCPEDDILSSERSPSSRGFESLECLGQDHVGSQSYRAFFIQNPPLTYGPHTLTGESTDAGGGSPHQKLDKLITKHTDIMRTNSDTVAVFQSGLLWSDKRFFQKFAK